MKFRSVIDAYMADQRAEGRISSDASETVYRLRLNAHAEDVQNRDPRYTSREDVKRTLVRFSNPNTQAHCRSILVSFYGWLEEEGIRKDNPARQTRRPRTREPQVYRLTRDETLAMLRAPRTTRERRAIFLGFCAGLRNAELRGMQGRHFQRQGWIWVSEDIAKGHKDRQVPVIAELVSVVEEIQANVGLEEYVLPGRRLNPRKRETFDVPNLPCQSESLVKLVKEVGRRAGIAAPIKPHAMRHAYADHIARFAGVRRAQSLLGHARIATTEGYLSKPTMEELALAVEGFGFGLDTNERSRGSVSPPPEGIAAVIPVNSASTDPSLQSGFPALLASLFASPVLREAARRMG